MGTNTRHFKALMRKNFINWKRTPLGSALELLLPSLLMLILVLGRSAIKPSIIESVDLSSLQHPSFPMTSLNSKNNTWSLNAKAFQAISDDPAFQAMMRYSNYTNTGLNSSNPTYNPMVDVKAPFLFSPPHCQQQSKLGYNSPIIAYIKSDSSIQKDIVSQLQTLFQQQYQFGKFLSENKDSIDLSELIGKSELQASTGSFFKGTQTKVSSKIAFQTWQFQFKQFASKDELQTYIAAKDFGTEQHPAVCFGFQVHERAKNDIELELFFNDFYTVQDFQSIPTQRVPPVAIYSIIPSVQSYVFYQWYGFGYMQNWVANTILKRRTGNDDAKIVSMEIPMKMPPFVKDDFKAILGTCLAIIIVLMFVPSIYRTTYRITQEKEMKSKESMMMMGLKLFPYWMSWFVYYITVMLILVTLAVLLMFGILKHSNMFMVWILILAFGISTFGIIMAVQALFSKARVSAIVCTTLYLISIMAWFLTQKEQTLSEPILWAISSVPGSCFCLTTTVLLQFETSGIFVGFHNWDMKYKGWSVKNGVTMQFIDIIIWLLIGIYAELIMPKEFGKPLKPWFMFIPSFWCPQKKKIEKKKKDRNIIFQTDNIDESATELKVNTAISDLIKEQTQFETKYMNSDFYEPVPAEIAKQELNQKHLEIKDLFKVYNNGFKAVNGINLKMYSDQIFVLLGHNGAGKTSTISMLTGLFGASEGQASVFGVDMFNQTDELRQFMGVCPQHEVLFELLTPQEHLDIFYDFKGADPNPEVKWTEINKLLVDVGVDDKRHTMSSQLSGGNQRKVSVCVALCGNSKFVLLDEPSSGLDLSARRQMWNMLKEHKKDKIIILTTHYMDEADILGDRIAIMSQGKVTCLGTSMFLKHKFGVGYTMTVVKTTSMKNKTVLQYLRRNIGPDVKKITEVHQEMTFQIPTKYSDKFKNFFKVFDYQLPSLQIQSYGISITTLEEVFLKVGHLTDPSKAIQEIDEKPDDEFDPYNPLRTFSHQIPGQELGNFDQKMEDYFSKKKGHQDDIVTSMLLDPKSAQKDETGSEDFPEIIDDPKALVSQEHLNVNARNSDQIGLKKIQSHIPTLQNVIEDEEIAEIASADSESIAEKFDPSAVRRIVSEINMNKYESLFEKDLNKEVKYSLKTAKLERSFCYHLQAVFFMRWSIYKRNLRGLVNELILPALLVVSGMLISKIGFYSQAQSKLIVPSLMPLPNKLLVNQAVYNSQFSDTQTSVLWQNLPEAKTQFNLTYAETFGKNMTYKDYQASVINYGRNQIREYPYLYGSYEVFQINKQTQQYKFFTFLNMTCQDCAAFYPQFMYESILKVATDDPQFSFKVRNTAYPITQKVRSLQRGTNSAAIVFMEATGFSVSCAMIIGYIVSERAKQLKHMQTMTGLRLDAYWIGNYIIDWIKLLSPILTMVIGQKTFGLEYNGSVPTFLVYPIGALPFLYCASFLFTVESAAQTFTLFFNFLVGTITPGFIFVIRMNLKLGGLGDIINWILRLIPNYAISNSIFFDANGPNLEAWRAASGKGRPIAHSQFGIENDPSDAFCIIGMGIFWTICLIAIENGLSEKLSNLYEKSVQNKYPPPIENREKDEDVRIEENRVKRKRDNQLEIKVQDFRKCYMTGKGPCNPGTPFLAVEKLSFGLSVGECFCLLGVNGAGKSTTFKSLTCEVKPTSGSIKIAGFNIQTEWSKVRQLIGYCPQTNPIFESMSVEEHIDYYARIKGISAKEKIPLIEDVIKELGLESHRSKAAGTLSGGNKRKLSVAIAIIGNPQIILLDEPSAGMDPESRRFMWQVVAKISNEKTSAVILTTHLMEEAEALCTKMGIMVKGGVFKCFGSSQHIKNKFGTGYVVDIKIRQPNQEDIQQLIDEELPQTGEVDIHGNKLINVQTAKSTLSRNYSNYIVNYIFDDIQEVETAAVTKDRVKNRGIKKIASKKEQQQTYVSAQDLATSLFTQNACIATIEELCQVFGQVQLLEKYGGFMSIRVARQQKTIGFVFGYLDEIKAHCDISEYSVSQTTLEQIFQGFANLKFDEEAQNFYLNNETGDLVRQ